MLTVRPIDAYVADVTSLYCKSNIGKWMRYKLDTMKTGISCVFIPGSMKEAVTARQWRQKEMS